MPPKWFPSPGGSGGTVSVPAGIQNFTSSSTSTITLSSAQAGDFIVAALVTNGTGLGGPTALAASGGAQYAYQVAFGGGPPYLYLHTHQVSQQDVTGGKTFQFLSSLGSFGAYAALLLRHTYGATDGFSTIATTTNNTAAAVHSFVTTSGSDVGIIVVGMQAASNLVSTAPTGYTIGPNIGSDGSTHQGVAILYNPNVGPAGTISPGNVTVAINNGTTATVAFGLRGFITNY